MRAQRVDAATLARLLGNWAHGDAVLSRQLADALADLIASNSIADGTLFPPQRQLATALGLARGTVAEAYQILAESDQLSSRQGSGTRVRRRGAGSGGAVGDGRLRSFTGHAHALLDFSSGALPGLALVREAFELLDVAALGQHVDTDGYHPAGLPGLRAAIAEQYTRDGLPTTTDEILVTAGAQQAVWLIAHSMISAGDDIAVEEPTYRGALEAFRACGANLVSIPVRDHGIDIDHLRRVLSRCRPRLLYCQPSAHNPTGLSMPEHARSELATLLTTQGVPVVEDTCSADLILDDRGFRKALAANTPINQTVSIGTTSKLFWGGLRVGWLRGDKTTISRLAEAKKAIDLSCPVIDQMLAAQLITATERARDERTVQLRSSLHDAENLLADLQPSWNWKSPSGGTGLWIDTGQDAVALAARASRRGLRLAAGPAFSAFDGFRNHLRLPFWHPLMDLNEAMNRFEPRTRPGASDVISLAPSAPTYRSLQ